MSDWPRWSLSADLDVNLLWNHLKLGRFMDRLEREINKWLHAFDPESNDPESKSAAIAHPNGDDCFVGSYEVDEPAVAGWLKYEFVYNETSKLCIVFSLRWIPRPVSNDTTTTNE